MSLSFKQWKGHAAKGDIKRVIWCHGDQAVLIEEVVDTIRQQLAPSDLDYTVVEAGTVPDRDVWTATNHYPLVSGSARLVIIRHAHLISNWSGLQAWLKERRSNPRTYLLFVSQEKASPLQYQKSTREVPEHIEWIQHSGHVIRCKQMSLDDLTWWAKTLAPLSDATADYLATRTAGNAQQLKSVCRKLVLFEETPSTKVIDELCTESPLEDFVDLLMLFQRREALAIADFLSVEDYHGVMSLLDYRLTVMSRLHWAVRMELSRREISALPDVPYFLADRFMLVAKYYDAARCRHRRHVVAVLDEALSSGAQEGILESLVALWG